MPSEWHVLNINPEPWAIGTISTGRNRTSGKVYSRIAPNLGLQAYQQAVKEALGEQELIDGRVHLEFWFWRRQDRYESLSSDKEIERKIADTTNLQKALEDALQGVFYLNDRDVDHTASWIVEQSPETEPRVVIRVWPCSGADHPLPPSELLSAASIISSTQSEGNRWDGPSTSERQG